MRKKTFHFFFQNILIGIIALLIIKALQSCSDPCASQPPENLKLRVTFKSNNTEADTSLTFTSIQGTGTDSITFQSEDANDTINFVELSVSPFIDTAQYIFTREGQEAQSLTVSYQRSVSTACGFKTSITGINIKNHNFVEADLVRTVIDIANENNIILYF